MQSAGMEDIPMLRAFSLVTMMLAAAASSAQAQQYPDRPVHVLVGYAAGSGPDIQARTVAQQLSINLGQQFYVENRLGANGTIAARSVATANPDGYTLLFSSNGIAPTPYVYKNLGYDIYKDITPVATQGILDGLLMLVDAKSDIKTLQQFIEHAKKERVIYGSPGVGNGLHLATELFSKAAGIKTPPALVDKLNAAIHAALLAPAVASVMQRDGYIPDNRNAAATAVFFRKEV